MTSPSCPVTSNEPGLLFLSSRIVLLMAVSMNNVEPPAKIGKWLPSAAQMESKFHDRIHLKLQACLKSSRYLRGSKKFSYTEVKLLCVGLSISQRAVKVGHIGGTSAEKSIKKGLGRMACFCLKVSGLKICQVKFHCNGRKFVFLLLNRS